MYTIQTFELQQYHVARFNLTFQIINLAAVYIQQGIMNLICKSVQLKQTNFEYILISVCAKLLHLRMELIHFYLVLFILSMSIYKYLLIEIPIMLND